MLSERQKTNKKRETNKTGNCDTDIHSHTHTHYLLSCTSLLSNTHTKTHTQEKCVQHDAKPWNEVLRWIRFTNWQYPGRILSGEYRSASVTWFTLQFASLKHADTSAVHHYLKENMNMNMNMSLQEETEDIWVWPLLNTFDFTYNIKLPISIFIYFVSVQHQLYELTGTFFFFFTLICCIAISDLQNHVLVPSFILLHTQTVYKSEYGPYI